MHQREQHGAEGGGHCPSMGGEECFHLHEAARVGDASFRQIGHDDDRKNDLIGRKSQHKGQQDHSVKAHQPGKRIEKSGADGQKAGSADGDVCHDPEEHAGRRRYRRRSAEDKECSFHDRADDDFSNLRTPVRRQLQSKRRRNAL